ncbi:MAG: chromate efflux transporter [Chloroflexi bacterium]|nr:chromate efflux transporter [Chloroflexota bacterium]
MSNLVPESQVIHRAASGRGYLRETALLFLRLGATSFGGPAVYISLMHDETVRRRRWVGNQRFLDMIGVTNLIPGPNATELAIYLGLVRAGWAGAIAGGVLFIVPGMLATLGVAWAYVTYGSMPQVAWVLYGVKPVVVAIVIQAVWSLSKSGLRGVVARATGGAVLMLYLLGFNEIMLLFGGAVVVLLASAGRRAVKTRLSAIVVVPGALQPSLAALQAVVLPLSQTTVFLTFLKIGAVLYGSGYVLLAFITSEFVDKLGWLTNQQVLDAIAVGQITPGPVFSSATFVGYLVGGWPSALVATLGIFLPSFLLVGLLSRMLPAVRKSPWAGAFLDGVNAASLALMVGVTIKLGRDAVVDVFTIGLAVAALPLVLRSRVNSVWLIVGGAILGMAYKFVTG